MNTIQTTLPSPQSGTHKVLLMSYILYLLVIPFPFLTVIGVVLAYVFRSDAQAYLKTHADYLVRSFWIGLLYFTISSILCLVLVGFVLILLAEVWWLIRLAIGLKALVEEKPISDVNTWWF